MTYTRKGHWFPRLIDHLNEERIRWYFLLGSLGYRQNS
jgi:hypothetical protein